MTTSGYIEFMVVPHSDGTVEVFAPGQLPAGTSYFIIENQADKKAEVHLQCFPPS